MFRHFFIILTIIFTFSAISAQAARESDIDNFERLEKQFEEVYKSTDDYELIISSAEKMDKQAPRAFGKYSARRNEVTLRLAQLYNEKISVSEYENRTQLRKDAKNVNDLYKKYFQVKRKTRAPKDILYLENYIKYIAAKFRVSGPRHINSNAKEALIIARNLNLSAGEIGDIYYFIAMQKVQNMDYAYANEIATDSINDALNQYTLAYGPNHNKVADSIYWLAKAETKKGNAVEAEKKFLQALKQYEDNNYDKTSVFYDIHISLIKLYEATGRKDQATQHVIACAVDNLVNKDAIALYYPVLDFPNDRSVQGYISNVEMKFNIDTHGYAKDIKITSSNNRVYDLFAIKSLKEFRFAPTIKDGEIIESKNVRYDFSYTYFKKMNPYYTNRFYSPSRAILPNYLRGLL
ncbi:MAG: hypothetical protein HOH19_02635 [Kordiimonadaceae bacterium]|jgi:TolA-binding protein|nr:hypothetical protein [Kordiimonadaceae bacterium]MBT6031445.1 hypothetical protein [Kordiimonadaceae bacterium]